MPAAWDTAVAQIEAADIPCPVYRTARRLLDRAAAGDGFVALNDADLRAICQSEAEGTLRSHLIQMQAAGILSYSRRTPRHGAQDATIFIQFEAWSSLPLPIEDAGEDEVVKKMIDQRSNLIDQRSFSESADEGAPIGPPPIVKEMIDQRSFTRAERSKKIDERSFFGSTSHARLGRLGRSLSSTSKTKKPTYPPTSQAGDDATLEPMQQLALDLLEDSDVGVLHELAVALAREKPVQDIYRAVDRWLSDVQDGRVGPGVLKHRISTLVPTHKPTVRLSAEFLSSDLFRRHRLPDELLAGEKRSYNPADYRDGAPRKRYSAEAQP
jgi:hypothetical protein